MARLRNLPNNLEQRSALIKDLASHGVDPETCWADFGEYDSDWETAAAALGVELPINSNLNECRASLKPCYWRTYEQGFNPL